LNRLTGVSPLRLAAALRNLDPTSGGTLYLGHADDTAGEDRGWSFGPTVAVDPRFVGSGFRGETRKMLEAVERRRVARRRVDGSRQTGILLGLGYHALDPAADLDDGENGNEPPDWFWAEVDGSIHWADGVPRAAGLDADGRAQVEQALASAPASPEPPESTTDDVTVRTSLSRDAYLEAVRTIQRAIGEGEIYQANLCQRFECRGRLDLWEAFIRLPAAPRSAFVDWDGLTVASMSPETFLVIDGNGSISTWPIKGTRVRDADPAEDRRLADELLRSEKDRAELLMIVDLERNDLGRIALPGTVRVGPFPELRRYTNVQHLVTRVSATLRPECGLPEWIEATFPGGSITGAPKIRARQLLAEIEPVPRNFFTGSLVWLGDDGHVESSILIRTYVGHGDRTWIGAGGGIVTDSDPVAEWRESNDKVRPLCRGLGFEPEDAA